MIYFVMEFYSNYVLLGRYAEDGLHFLVSDCGGLVMGYPFDDIETSGYMFKFISSFQCDSLAYKIVKKAQLKSVYLILRNT